MKRTILIPTDFSEESLSLVAHVIANAGDHQLDIVLTHCMFLPDSEDIDMRFFSKKELIQSLQSHEFKKACRSIRNQNANRNALIRTDIFTGLNQTAFNNFIEGNEIEEAVIPKPYKPTMNQKRSFDPTPFIRKSRLKITEVEI